MTNLEKIKKLKKYREILIYATGYQEEVERNNIKKKDKPKVLTLKRKFYGKTLRLY